MASTAERNRLEDLLLSIYPDAEQQQEIARLERKCKQQSPVIFDDVNDPDPDCTAGRLDMIWREQYKHERKMNEYRAALAERHYAKRGKELNSVVGFKN